MSDIYEIYAIKYAHHERRASENFIGGDPHDGPMPLDYFIWAIVGEDRSFVVDTGFDQAMGDKRQRTMLRPPSEGIKQTAQLLFILGAEGFLLLVEYFIGNVLIHRVLCIPNRKHV